MTTLDRRSFIAAGAVLGVQTADVPARAASRPAARVTGLRVAMLTDPIGIESIAPTLAWRLEGEGALRQSAYRILVASSAEKLAAGRGDLWDSGRIAGDDCTGVIYRGSALRSRQICHWKVQVWDGAGRSLSSEAARWEMGLLDPADWRGRWLAIEDAVERDDRLAGATWVGGTAPSPAQPRSFRLRFATGRGAAHLTLVGDGTISRVAVDGTPIPLPPRDPNGFGGAPALSVPLEVTAGDHDVTVDIAPTPGFAIKPVVAVAAQLRIVGRDGRVARIGSGWDTRLGTAGAWSAAEPLAKQPVFPWPPTPARLVRRRFRAGSRVLRARLYVAALGGYRFWLNGQRANDDEMQAEPVNYAKRVPYRVYDVTRLVRQGDNMIGAMVGDGHYASYQAPDGRYAFGPAPRRIRAMLALTYEDGRTEHVATDGEWRHRRAPVLMSDIYAGEDHDRAQWPVGWNVPDAVDDGGWEATWDAPAPTVPCTAALAQPVRVVRTLPPVSIRRVGPDRHVVDFGQNLAGRVRLQVTGTSGQEVVVRHAEILATDGAMDRRNLRAARAEDRYRLRGDVGGETLEPVFTYQGFRYAEVAGLPSLTPAMIRADVLSSALPEIGLVTLSVPRVEKLWLNTLWSQRSNFMGIPTDCPQRDERLGWTGDAQVFWDTASFNMDTGAFTRSFCRTLRDAQGSNGAYPLWAPSPGGIGWGTDTPTPGWADAGVMLPYTAYLHGGDRSIVDENWAAMERYAGGILAANPDGVWSKGRGADLGDWLSLDAKSPMDATTPKDLIATAMLARTIRQLADMARWTGRTRDAARWDDAHRTVARAFARSFVTADGVVGNGSQCSYILALGLGLVPDAVRANAGRRLTSDIRRRGTLLSTGFLGTPLALDALADVGEHSLVWDLLLRTDYPSWGYMVTRGATSIWERWNGDTGDVAMNSFNHYALGAVCGFLYRRVAGIAPLTPGFARFRIAPVLDPRASSGGGRLESVRGVIETKWRTDGVSGTIKVAVPANSTAELVLPGKTTELNPGRHRVTW